MKKYILLSAVSALAIPAAAFAQTSGQQQMDQQTIVVTGNRTQAVDGVQVPKTTKAKEVLTSAFIQHQTPGQSIDEVINMLPGVSFQNNDPYGNSGGTLTIRGFDNTRISQTFDGLPLNDTGNYALYSSEQLDSELINQVNVNLGTTDLDSPTASATGSTVNYTSRNPTDDFHARLQGSLGSYDYFRMFGLIDTGTFTSIGTKAWLSASHAENENPFEHTSKTDKYQYNGKIYQPIGSHGDFIWFAFNWNHSINGNFSSVPLRTDLTQNDTVNTAPRIVGSGSTNRFPLTNAERNYTFAPCQVAVGHFGVADSTNSCGTAFDYSFNPSDNGNIRMNSRFTLADNLFLTLDAGYQFVKANGGSSAVKGNEGTDTVGNATGLIGYIGGQPYFGGVDLNGDGDTLDTTIFNPKFNSKPGVEVYAPSHTETHRIDFVADLLYNIAPDQTIRLTYSYDRGRHRQTGEVGPLTESGFAEYVYPIDHPMLDLEGNILEKRNRLSYAILHQVSGEYRGGFFDDKLTIDIGARAPFFTRNLNNYCVTEYPNTSFVDCFGDPAMQAAFLTVNPTYTPPTHRELHYSKLLPQAGLTYDFTRNVGLFANYSRGLQVPSTDSLYNWLGEPAGTAPPVPEVSDNFDTGIRYRSSKVQAQLTGWYTIFKNRLASAFDPVLDITVFRNLGTVHKYGLDANVAYQVTPNLSLMGFGSYLKSKILNNLVQANCVALDLTQHTNGCTVLNQPIYAMTAGKRELGAPTFTLGGRVQGDFGPLEIGIQAKRTGPRYVNDQNIPVYQCTTSARGLDCSSGGTAYPVYGAKAPAYTTVDLDARLSLKWAGFNDRTYLQLNVTNILDKLYVAGFGGNTSQFSIPFAYIGAPRAISGTLVVGF